MGFTGMLKKMNKKEQIDKSKNAAKERLHLVLMQDRAHVSADFLEMMKQEIVDVIKKYIDVDENEMDVKLENKVNEDGTSGAPSLYANIPIVSINEEKKKESQEIAKSKQEEAKSEKETEKVAEKEKKKKVKKESSIKKIAEKKAKTDKTEKAEKAEKEKKTAVKKATVKEKVAAKVEKKAKADKTTADTKNTNKE